MENLKVSVVIPARNEEKSIGGLIDRVKHFANEVIVVVDSSADNTVLIAKQRGIKVLKNSGKPGKGSAVRFALDNIKSDIILFIDADCSHRIEDIPNLLKPILEDRADLVIASRLEGGSEELFNNFEEWIRGIGIVLSTFIINMRWNARLTDVHNGFRAIKFNVAKQLNLKEPRFAYELEMVIKCLKNRKVILEIPSYEFRRKYGSSHLNPMLNLFDCTRCLIKNILF